MSKNRLFSSFITLLIHLNWEYLLKAEEPCSEYKFVETHN